MTAPHKNALAAAVAWLGLGASVAFTQTTPPATAAASADEALVLSPFEVRGELDTGYLAQFKYPFRREKR